MGCLDSFVEGTVIKKFPFLNGLYSWGVLNIASGTGKTSYSDQTIMFAAGYLEGALTAR